MVLSLMAMMKSCLKVMLSTLQKVIRRMIPHLLANLIIGPQTRSLECGDFSSPHSKDLRSGLLGGGEYRKILVYQLFCRF